MRAWLKQYRKNRRRKWTATEWAILVALIVYAFIKAATSG